MGKIDLTPPASPLRQPLHSLSHTLLPPTYLYNGAQQLTYSLDLIHPLPRPAERTVQTSKASRSEARLANPDFLSGCNGDWHAAWRKTRNTTTSTSEETVPNKKIIALRYNRRYCKARRARIASQASSMRPTPSGRSPRAITPTRRLLQRPDRTQKMGSPCRLFLPAATAHRYLGVKNKCPGKEGGVHKYPRRADQARILIQGETDHTGGLR